jgi:ArsR family transcriptional regulator, virulence genes transcriptional regulator
LTDFIGYFNYNGMTPIQNTCLDQLMLSSKETADILKVLSHHMRLLAVCFIGNGEKTVQELSERLSTSQSNMSQHLAKMRSSGILQCRKEANLVYYSIRDPRTTELVAALQNIYCNEKPAGKK